MRMETTKIPEGSLDWWMRLIDDVNNREPKLSERKERARLLMIVLRAWDAARAPERTVDEGLPANMVCGKLVEAAAELLSCDYTDALRKLDVWATMLFAGDDEDREIGEHRARRRIDDYFIHEWTR